MDSGDTLLLSCVPGKFFPSDMDKSEILVKNDIK